MAQRNGTGMFPREIMNRFPLLPLEEEGRLNDMPLRENFIERVFAYYRWTRMLDDEPTPGGLVKFHTAHKLTLMAHSPKHYTEMGRLVADAGKLGAIQHLLRHTGIQRECTLFAGDSGNDLDVLASWIPAVLVANATAEVRAEAIERSESQGTRERLYLARGGNEGMNGNYAAGILEGLDQVNRLLHLELEIRFAFDPIQCRNHDIMHPLVPATIGGIHPGNVLV